MPGRDNDQRKMELRLRALDQKHEKMDARSQRERAQMEMKANAKFTINYIEWFYPKKHHGFIVNLKNPLSEDEIRSRMIRGFGDL